MAWTIGVGAGGAFIDFYAPDEASGAVVYPGKRPSTPDNPARAVVRGDGRPRLGVALRAATGAGRCREAYDPARRDRTGGNR